jgi:N-acetylneuraminate lyase
MTIVMKKKFHGLWPAMLTPLTSDGKPAFSVMEHLVELFVQQRLDGIYLTGSTGQWPSLSFDERTAIMDCVIKAAAGRIPVMAHIGAVTTDDAIKLAQQAARLGADAVSSVAPIYYAHSEAVVFEHYRQIGQATDLPFYVYHLSSANPAAIGAKSYAEKLLSIPNLAGMKITDVNLYLFGLIQAGTEGRLQLFSGADEVMCQAVLSGAIGAIGTFYNLWGPACRAARQAMVDGKTETAMKFMLRFQTAISRVIDSGAIWQFLRAAMRMKYDLEVGMPRHPLGLADKPWDEAKVREVINLVDGE